MSDLSEVNGEKDDENAPSRECDSRYASLFSEGYDFNPLVHPFAIFRAQIVPLLTLTSFLMSHQALKRGRERISG